MPHGQPDDSADVSNMGSISTSTAATPCGGTDNSAAIHPALANGSAAMGTTPAHASTVSAGVADPQSQVAALRDEKAALAAEKAEAEAALVAARAQEEELLGAAHGLHAGAKVAGESKSVASQVGTNWMG